MTRSLLFNVKEDKWRSKAARTQATNAIKNPNNLAREYDLIPLTR